MAAIQNLCERVLLLQDSKLQRDGAPDDIIAKYLSGARNNQSQNDLSKIPRAKMQTNFERAGLRQRCWPLWRQYFSRESLELRLKYECPHI